MTLYQIKPKIMVIAMDNSAYRRKKMTELETPFFEKNMAMLKANHSHIFDIVSGYSQQNDETKLVESENRKFNLKGKTTDNEWVFIHEPSDPGVEANDFLAMVAENSTGVVLMFGMGLGYTVQELLKKRKKIQCLILFELNVEFLVLAFKHMDLSQMFSDKRLIICAEKPDDLSSIMAPANRSLMLENIHTLSLTPCFKVNKDYGILAPLVADYISAYNAEGNTKIFHGRTFIENRLKHLTSMHHDKKLEDLAGKYKGMPALIVAAGPSLDKNIDQIHKAVGKAVIICVDSALPSLLKHNIQPDFVSSIDYKELTYEKISGVASNPLCKQINLICTTWVTSLVPKIFPAKNVFWAYSRNPLEDWINRSMGGEISIGGAGTVAHLNFVSADIMGCEPIIFVGQDLAFSSRKSHSSNVVLTNEDTVKKMLDNGQEVMWVKGVTESEVPTNRQMQMYRRTFEQMIEESGKNVVNSTEGGALIEGAEHMPLSSAIEQFCDVEINLGIEFVGNKADLLKSMESTLKQVRKIEKVIQKAEKLSGPLQKKLLKLYKGQHSFSSFSELPEALQLKISDLDACHKKADNTPVFSIFDEMTMEGLRQNQREVNAIENLENVPEKYLEWLTRSVARIDQVNKIRMDNLDWFSKQLSSLIRYYKKENSIEKQLKKDKINSKIIDDLAQLYYESSNYVLLEKMLERYASGSEESASIHYYCGIVALYHGDYETAENRFQSALNCDGAYAKSVDQKRNEIADYYFKLAKSLYGNASGTLNPIVVFLLLKGLKCCPDHTAIKNEFRRFAEDDLAKIKQRLEEKKEIKLDSSKRLLEKWIHLIDREKGIRGCLKKDKGLGFYRFYGKILVDEKKYQEALNHYQRALLIMPDNPDIYIAIADIYFAIENYDSGLHNLKTAVSFDKKYAVYWHNMGKNLQAQKDYNGAILAYEQYFMALPENIAVLKEIGDCHTKLGNLDAAYESYQQFKKLLNK